jgi:type III pantothenate kinase
MAKDYFNIKPVVVDSNIKMNIRIRTDNPEEVGADRIANAVAVYEIYGGPSIIVDFGTATTFCALDREGNYLGGAIAPGLEICSFALFEKTAKLPEVELIEPEYAIGKTTVKAIQSGIYFAHLGLVKELINQFKRELGGDCRVIATGGQAELIEKRCILIDKIDPLLTLKGLRIIFQLNSN